MINCRKFFNDDKKLNCDLWSHQEMDQMSIATTVMEFHVWGYKISRISAYFRVWNKHRGRFITFWKNLEFFFEKWPQCLDWCKKEATTLLPTDLFTIDIINNKARHNLIDAKYEQMAFQSVPTTLLFGIWSVWHQRTLTAQYKCF